MEKINKVYIGNKKNRHSTNKKSILNAPLASILKLNLAVAIKNIFFTARKLLASLAILILLSLIVNAGDTTVATGDMYTEKGNELFLSLKNTEAGGHDYRLVSAGSVGGIGVGKFSIFDATAGLSRLTVDSSGNVGIGTTSPQGKLHVVESATQLQAGSFSNPTNGAVSGLQVTQGTSPTGFGGHLYLVKGGNKKSWHLNIASTDGLNFVETGVADYRLYLAPGGNVGIGTASPTRKLDVHGGDIAIHMDPSNGGLIFGDNDPVNDKWHIGYWEPSIMPPAGGLVFTETGVADYILTLKAGGNVGIGTANPGAKLDVNGDIKSADELRNAARGICYSALPAGETFKSLIMIPLPAGEADLDVRCHTNINTGWHAGGVAKSYYSGQNCADIDNGDYGSGYTSFITEADYEANRATSYTNCGPSNAVICCSPQFTN